MTTQTIPADISARRPIRPGHALGSLLAAALAGCGQPPPQAGMPADFPVSAVVAQVEQRPLAERLELVGSVRAKEEVRLVSEVDGRIIEIGFDEGGPVREGTVLFRLDARKQEARLAEARARLDLATADLRRGEELLERRTIPPQEFDRLNAAYLTAEAEVRLLGAELEDATVKAPFDGIMGERPVSVGQVVARGAELAVLYTVDPVELEFSVPERYAGQLEDGRKVEMSTIAYPDLRFEGTVGYVAPRLDADSRTIRVKADIPNAEGLLRPGMFGSVWLTRQVRDDALLIPEAAVRFQGDTALVTVVGEDGIAAIQPVTTGTRLEGMTEVVAGVKAGQLVVVEGFQKIRPGGRVTVAPESSRYGIAPDRLGPPSGQSPPPPANGAPEAGPTDAS